MKNWRQWPWKQWGKKYLFYLALWLAVDLLLQGIEERKSLTTLFLAAPGKALMFLFIFEIAGSPTAGSTKHKNNIAADSDNKILPGNGNTTIE